VRGNSSESRRSRSQTANGALARRPWRLPQRWPKFDHQPEDRIPKAVASGICRNTRAFMSSVHWVRRADAVTLGRDRTRGLGGAAKQEIRVTWRQTTCGSPYRAPMTQNFSPERSDRFRAWNLSAGTARSARCHVKYARSLRLHAAQLLQVARKCGRNPRAVSTMRNGLGRAECGAGFPDAAPVMLGMPTPDQRQ